MVLMVKERHGNHVFWLELVQIMSSPDYEQSIVKHCNKCL